MYVPQGRSVEMDTGRQDTDLRSAVRLFCEKGILGKIDVSNLSELLLKNDS